jgi:hypothetical protein
MAKLSTKGIVALVIGLTIAGSLLVPVSDVFTDSTGTVNQTEDVSAELDSYVELSGYDIQSVNNVTDSDGNTIDSGNYTVDNDAGRIRFASGDHVTEGETVTVDYDYQRTDGSTTTVAGIVPLLLALFLLVKLATKVGEMS